MSKVLSGLPTDLEVKRLLKQYAELEVDREIEYAEVAELISARRGSSRFKTVTDAWRRRVWREQRVRIGTVAGRAFKVLSASDASLFEGNGVRVGARRIVRGARHLSLIDAAPMNERERDAHTHRRKVAVAMAEDVQTRAKELAPPRAQRQLPRAASKD